MRTKFSSVIFLIFLSTSLFSQQNIFEKGQIVTIDNDTIDAFVELAVTYNINVKYKSDINGKVKQIRIDNIKSLSTPYNYYKKVMLNKRSSLFRVMIDDKYSLFQMVMINTGSSSPVAGGTMTAYSAPTIIYAIRYNNEDYVLKKKKDIELIYPIIADCSDVKMQVEKESFKLDDLEEIIKKLNDCK